MQHSPSSEANSSPASQIHRILWDPKIHHRLHKCGPLALNLSYISPHPVIVLSIHFNITLPSTVMSSKWALSLRFSHQVPVPCMHLSSIRRWAYGSSGCHQMWGGVSLCAGWLWLQRGPRGGGLLWTGQEACGVQSKRLHPPSLII